MKKRLWVVLLALVMALCLLPAMSVAALAEEIRADESSAVTMTQNGEATNYETITAAINATDEYNYSTNRGQYVITLNEDRTEDVTIPANRSIKIDLNGHKLTNVSGHTITNNSTRTYITDTSADKTGVVDNVTHGKGAVYNNINSTITLQGGTYTRSQEASVSDTDAGSNSWYVIKNFGTMTIQNGVTVKFSDSNNGVYSSLIGNGWQSYSDAEDGTNGEPKPSDGGNKASLTISGGTFTGGQITIKNDDYGVLNISGGTFTQPSENRYAVLNNNTATISGGTFSSKSTVIGSLYFEGDANTGEITIKNGTFTSKSSNAVYVGAGANLTLTGGTFSTNSSTAYIIGLATGASAEISGGRFPYANTDYVVNSDSAFKGGYGIVENSDGSISVGVTDESAAVAQVNNIPYTTLDLAIAAASNGETITLLKDIKLDSPISISSKVVIDLAGYTITAPDNSYIAVVAGGGDFTLDDSSAAGTGKLTGGTGDNSHAGAVTVQNGGSFTMNGGNITGNTGTTKGAGVSLDGNATFTMTGGSITNNTATVNLQAGVYANRQSTVTISGNVTITGNTGNDLGSTVASDIWLDTLNGATLTIGGDGLDPAAKIGVYVNGGVSDVKVFTSTYESGTASAENFTSNRSKYYVFEVETEGGKAMALSLYKAAAPTASLQPGIYVGPQVVTLSTTTYPNLTSIYYTIDGTDPKTSETRQKYTEPLTITETTTVKAYTTGLSGDYLDSDVVEFTYTITTPSKPPVNIPNTYDIDVANADNGSVSASLSNASEGTTITLTVIPEEGYVLGSLTVTGPDGRVDVESINSTTYTFRMPDGDVTVSASFVREGLPFTDVDTDDWFYDEVKYAYDNGLMDGVGNNLFAPETELTRGMIVTILWRLEGEPAGTGAAFDDVAEGQWYADAVNWAAANGIVDGYGDGTYRPEKSITREEMAVIMHRYAVYKGYDVSASGDLSVFTDGTETSSWAVEAMEWATGAGLINGMGNNVLSPEGTTTRAQSAAILMRFCENIVK